MLSSKKGRFVIFCGLLRIYIAFNFTSFSDRSWKFLVTVQLYDENTQNFTPICVGSIIGRNWVLTVKSCVLKILNLDNCYVLSNSTYSTYGMSKFKSIHRVEKFIPHKDMVRGHSITTYMDKMRGEGANKCLFLSTLRV